MSRKPRWKPPHEAKTIITENDHADTRQIKWTAPRCCWPNCPGNSYRYDDIPLCPYHVELVADREAPRRRERAEAIQERFTELAHKDDEYARRRAETNKRMPRDMWPREGVVYYLQVGVHIKIGFSLNLNARMRAYPPDSIVLGVEFGDKTLEKQRHLQFDAHRSLGREWFVDAQEIRDHIRDNCMAWAPAHKATVGPSGAPRAKLKLSYRSRTSGWKVA